MNRSILIVMCDFIVLSVMSLSTGVAPAGLNYSGGGTVVDDRTAIMIVEELKRKRATLELAEKELIAAREKLGGMQNNSARLKELQAEMAQIQANLEKLKKTGQPANETEVKASEVKAQINSNLAALASMKSKFSDADLDLLRKRIAMNHEQINEKNTKLLAATEELLNTKNRLAAAENMLNDTRSDLDKTKSALNQTKEKLLVTAKDMEAFKGKVIETQNDMFFVRGKLSVTEKELAESRSKMEKNIKNAMLTNLELSETKKKMDDLKNVIKNAVSDLSTTRTELDSVKKEYVETREKYENKQRELLETRGFLQSTQTALEETKIRMREAEERLRSDALQKYSQAAVKLDFTIKEKRFLSDYTGSETYYLPEITIEGKNYLAVNFNVITGLSKEISNHAKVYDLSYKIGEPLETDASKLEKNNGPIYSLNVDNRVCLVPLQSTKKALKPLSFTQLKSRGLQNLYLFKPSNFGKRTSNLEGRASLNLSENDKYLYIRNSTRRSDSELKAEVGDFIITKEGDFVGLIVSVEDFDMGRKQDAKCFILPDNFKISDAYEIPIVKQNGQQLYQGFMNAVNFVITKINTSGRNQRDRQ
ncbi:MAG: hypothetical protein ACYC4Q_04910 [Victivallaceae bacterium]